MNQRPTAITVICVLGFIGAGLSLLVLPMVGRLGLPGWYTPYLLASVVIGLVLMVGLWRMKKAAAFGYVGFTALNQVVMLLTGTWSVMSLVIPGVVCGIALANVSKME